MYDFVGKFNRLNFFKKRIRASAYALGPEDEVLPVKQFSRFDTCERVERMGFEPTTSALYIAAFCLLNYLPKGTGHHSKKREIFQISSHSFIMTRIPPTTFFDYFDIEFIHMSIEKRSVVPEVPRVENPWARLLRHEDYDLPIDGVTIRVLDHVFSPDPELTNSSSMILRGIPDVTGKTVLDVGAGTGVVGLRCAMKGAERVTSADVSDAALANIRENVDRLGVTDTVEIRKSDLFSDVPERFDYIFANLPILDEAWSQESGSTQHLVQRFLDEVPDHLNDGGTAYLVWGSFSDVEPLRAYLKTLTMNVRETQEEKMGFTWYLFAITKTS